MPDGLLLPCACGRTPLVNDAALHDVWSVHCSDLSGHGRAGVHVHVDWDDVPGTYRRLADAWNGKFGKQS